MNLNAIGGYWPLYEDGSPVRIGDTVQGTFDPMTVESVEAYATTTTVIGDCDHLHLSPGERVRRVGDAPEGVPCLCGDPDGGVGTAHVTRDNRNWHIVIDGVRYGVSTPARRVIAEALDLTTSRQTLPPGIEWPVVDGEPVVPGDVLWDADGTWVEVGAVRIDREGTHVEVRRPVPDDPDVYYVTLVNAGAEAFTRLTRTEPDPDSWERLVEDARKEFLDYWSCHDVACIDCPVKVDGETPCQRYDTSDCYRAKDLDIVARAKALSGVTDDE